MSFIIRGHLNLVSVVYALDRIIPNVNVAPIYVPTIYGGVINDNDWETKLSNCLRSVVRHCLGSVQTVRAKILVLWICDASTPLLQHGSDIFADAWKDIPLGEGFPNLFIRKASLPLDFLITLFV